MKSFPQLIFAIINLSLFPFKGQSQFITQENLQADYKILHEVLLSIHPALYRYNSQKSLNESFNKLQNQWESPVSEKTALKQLAQFIEKIHCGHTCINPYNLKDSLKNTMYPVDGFLPLYFKIIDGKIIVTGNASGNKFIKKGQEIVEINGVSTTTILDSLITAVKSDGYKNISNKYKSLELSELEQFSTFICSSLHFSQPLTNLK